MCRLNSRQRSGRPVAGCFNWPEDPSHAPPLRRGSGRANRPTFSAGPRTPASERSGLGKRKHALRIMHERLECSRGGREASQNGKEPCSKRIRVVLQWYKPTYLPTATFSGPTTITQTGSGRGGHHANLGSYSPPPRADTKPTRAYIRNPNVTQLPAPAGQRPRGRAQLPIPQHAAPDRPEKVSRRSDIISI